MRPGPQSNRELAMSLRLRTVPALLAGAAIAFSSQPGAARENTGTSATAQSPDQDTTSEKRSREEADIVSVVRTFGTTRGID